MSQVELAQAIPADMTANPATGAVAGTALTAFGAALAKSIFEHGPSGGALEITTTGPFTAPSPGDSVQIPVSSTVGLIPNAYICVENCGWLWLDYVDGLTLNATDLAGTCTVAPESTVPVGSRIVHSGARGPEGAQGAAAPVVYPPSGNASLVDLAQAGVSAIAIGSGAYTMGVSFAILGRLTDSIKIQGVHFAAKYSTYPRTIKCGLWSATGTLLASATRQVTAANDYNVWFATPYSVTAQNYTKTFYVGTFDQSGSAEYATIKPPSPLASLVNYPLIDGKLVRLKNNLYASGYACPLTATSADICLCEPIIAFG